MPYAVYADAVAILGEQNVRNLFPGVADDLGGTLASAVNRSLLAQSAKMDQQISRGGYATPVDMDSEGASDALLQTRELLRETAVLLMDYALRRNAGVDQTTKDRNTATISWLRQVAAGRAELPGATLARVSVGVADESSCSVPHVRLDTFSTFRRVIGC